MPCHVDIIPPRFERGEIETLVEVIRGRIKVTRFSDAGTDAPYQVVSEIVKRAKSQYKSFHYKVDWPMLVLVSPCPKGC